jgi:hypothetical protein
MLAAVPWVEFVLLALLLAFALWLRIDHNGYGLPSVFYQDEDTHAVRPAVHVIAGHVAPKRLENPTAFTYLLAPAFHVQDVGLLFGRVPDARARYVADPASTMLLARWLAAVLGTLAAGTTYLAARRLWGRGEAAVAGALMAVAFLAVTYSKIAVSDIGATVAVPLTLLWAERAHERDQTRDYVAASAAAGLAAGFKYTAAMVLLAPVVAAVLRARSAPLALARCGFGALAALVALLVTTPYLVVHANAGLAQIATEAHLDHLHKFGQAQHSGWSYYLGTLGWGFGWAGTAVAVAGIAVESRRRPGRALVLAVFPLFLLAYLSLQARWFGRWLLPALPALSMFAAVGLCAFARKVVGALPVAWRRIGVRVLTAVGALALVAQPLMADVRVNAVLGRLDTRDLARAFLAEKYPPRQRLVTEPAAPTTSYFVHRATGNYLKLLSPATIDAYRAHGVCLVETMSLVWSRAQIERTRRALAYYRRLDRESRVVFDASPYSSGSKPPPFHHDLSYNYYPTAYRRPGPEVRIHRLYRCHPRNGRLSRRLAYRLLAYTVRDRVTPTGIHDSTLRRATARAPSVRSQSDGG